MNRFVSGWTDTTMSGLYDSNVRRMLRCADTYAICANVSIRRRPLVN